MKKFIIWLSVISTILTAVIMATVLLYDIASVISLTPDNGDEITSIKIDINSATISELTMIPGIGKNIAQSIIAFRRENGPYQSIDDLLNVDGIGPGTYNKIADYLTVGG